MPPRRPILSFSELSGLLWPKEGDAGSLSRTQVTSPGLGGAGHIQGGPQKAKGLGPAGSLTPSSDNSQSTGETGMQTHGCCSVINDGTVKNRGGRGQSPDWVDQVRKAS